MKMIFFLSLMFTRIESKKTSTHIAQGLKPSTNPTRNVNIGNPNSRTFSSPSQGTTIVSYDAADSDEPSSPEMTACSPGCSGAAPSGSGTVSKSSDFASSGSGTASKSSGRGTASKVSGDSDTGSVGSCKIAIMPTGKAGRGDSHPVSRPAGWEPRFDPETWISRSSYCRPVIASPW